jgi:MoxR-like ATPase
MHASVTVTPTQLPELLLHIAVVRPVFIWGQPGIGKSSLVEEFAAQVGLECHTLLGTQLAAEDLIGVPRIIGEGESAKSRFCPPEAIARDEPYVLFLDELNGSSHEVQKAFYSLILDRRLGSYTLHPESVVIGAGNRSQDSAIVRPMSSALVNRMVHVHLVSSPRDWLAWARLAKELPVARAQLSGDAVQLAHRAKALLTELAEISVEAAQLVVAGAQDGVNEDGSDARLPSWFMVEVVRDLPRLAARDGAGV